jgi:aspartyl aminopeptidase
MKFSKKQLRNAKQQIKVFKEEQKSKEEEKVVDSENPVEEIPQLSEEDSKLLSSLSKKGKNVTIVNSSNLPNKNKQTTKTVKKNIKRNFKKEPPKIIFSFKEGDIVSYKNDGNSSSRVLGIYMKEANERYCYVASAGGIEMVRKSGIRKI